MEASETNMFYLSCFGCGRRASAQRSREPLSLVRDLGVITKRLWRLWKDVEGNLLVEVSVAGM